MTAQVNLTASLGQGPVVLRLEPMGQFPGKRVLTWHGATLYVADRYQVFRWNSEEGLLPSGQSQDVWWEPVASFKADRVRRLGSLGRISLRLLRAGFHALEVLPSGRLVGVVAKTVVVADPGEPRFRPTFWIQRGTRPLALTVTAQGKVYWGEYFSNPERSEVYIYGSEDQGESWGVVYTFPRGSIKHIHSVTWDPFGQCLWVFTGDYGNECRILRFTPDWKNVETVLVGDQQARAATGVPTSEALYFATDTPLAQNYIYRLDWKGYSEHRLERLHTMAGSSLQSCIVGRNLFFATAVEPSKINRSPYTTLVGSPDGRDWRELVRWRKDCLPAGFFQFGNILLPTGVNKTGLLAATGVAVAHQDMVMNLWRVAPDCR
jgi:hypothetical protein